ncbi:DUF2156 domain-containing protein [Methanoculleus sp. FWC-SCC1]|uniref:DUF2156 domain-containing protein n=1 Tax=Methanoculleus frigidifontis TaxID=2584085 RepID=A0ABT8M6D3_9EURY|nr:phosphatidylglycerol lysyltransferase domain-containing protein [Methanoculleus sp. FWC-SCC1]MDN7023501.1 DUF2156 domain-containing protein [Methanoculleus sp. FWC-SCC1]
MLSEKDFKPVTLEDRDIFCEHYARYPQVHSDNTFANMVCWNHYADYRYAVAGDAIMISSTIGGETTYRAPIGPKNRDLIEAVVELAARTGGERPLLTLDPDSTAWIREVYPALPLHPDRDFFDYIYKTDDLALLPGGEYLNIRRNLNKFRRAFSYRVEPITRENIDEVLEFLIVWCEWKDCDSVPILSYEREAVLFAMEHFFDLHLCGTIIRVGESIGAISVVGHLNERTAVVHFEKALPEAYRGIYRAINAETAAALTDRYLCLDRECDMGVPGLREAKMRYKPHHMVEVHYARKEDIQAILG